MEFLVSVDSFREVKNVRTNQETITVLWRWFYNDMFKCSN